MEQWGWLVTALSLATNVQPVHFSMPDLCRVLCFDQEYRMALSVYKCGLALVHARQPRGGVRYTPPLVILIMISYISYDDGYHQWMVLLVIV